MYGMTDQAILREIGRRLQRTRLDKNLSQQEVADAAGLSRTTVSEFERGAPAGVLTLIQVLRALGELDALAAMLPEPGPSPLQMARLKGKRRRRASRRTAPPDREDR